MIQDLLQYKDRDQWYLPKFVADDAPDWNPATFLRSRQLAPGVKEVRPLAEVYLGLFLQPIPNLKTVLMNCQVVLQIEISREQIPLRNAYKHIGQKAAIRVNSGIENVLPGEINQDAASHDHLSFCQPASLSIRLAQINACVLENTDSANENMELAKKKNDIAHCHFIGHNEKGLQLIVGAVVGAAVARGPFPQALNKEALFRARLDMKAGEIKAVKEVDSVKAELPLLVHQDDAPDIYKMAEDDAVEVGPFVVRSP